MTKLIYAASLLLVLAVPDTFASAQGERELMQQWLDSQLLSQSWQSAMSSGI
jgi:hypothetical protein